MKKWIDENPNHSEDDNKSHFIAKTVSTIGKPITSANDKIIKSISKATDIKESINWDKIQQLL